MSALRAEFDAEINPDGKYFHTESIAVREAREWE